MVFLQHLLPQHLLSGLMYRLARWTWRPWKDFCIRRFIARYRVDMGEANQTDARAYPSFNAFFIRGLRPDARPIDAQAVSVVSPVDGIVYQAGTLDGDRMIQAKGRTYSVSALLGGDHDQASRFQGGSFIALYLSPRDYHRVHMPVDGKLERMIYIPGRLYSVNPVTTEGIDNLFARNERVISVFRMGDRGRVAMCMVGAMLVGSMETVWHGQVTPAAARRLLVRNFDEGPGYRITKGGEMGRFNMGSTVILLFEPDKVEWNDAMRPGAPVRMGEVIGTLRTTR